MDASVSAALDLFWVGVGSYLSVHTLDLILIVEEMKVYGTVSGNHIKLLSRMCRMLKCSGDDIHNSIQFQTHKTVH